MPTVSTNTLPRRLSSDFWKFWIGQAISNLGSAITSFTLPLLIFKLTGSALNLALAVTITVLPYLLFGLIIGTWVDRVDRKCLMIVTDVARALVIASIPLMAALNLLKVWEIYTASFISATLSIGFNAAEFAAIPSLVGQDDLVRANGRIEASYSVITILGPFLGGLLLVVIPLPQLLLFDACSFLTSAASLWIIMMSFNIDKGEKKVATNLRLDMLEGVRYITGHQVTRNLIIMLVLINFASVTASTQIVLFAKQWLQASDTEVGLLYSAGSAGVIVFSLAAAYLRNHLSLSKVMLGGLMLEGLMTTALALSHWYWSALPLWALRSGGGMLFTITSLSILQIIVPNSLLGRVRSVARVLAWSSAPLGALVGSFAIERTQNVGLVYGVIGVIVSLIPLAFSFTSLGHTEDYLPQ